MDYLGKCGQNRVFPQFCQANSILVNFLKKSKNKRTPSSVLNDKERRNSLTSHFKSQMDDKLGTNHGATTASLKLHQLILATLVWWSKQ